MSLLKQHVSVCPGDDDHPPVIPLPPPPAPHHGRPLAHHPAHADPDVDAGGGMAGDPGPIRGRGGVPDPIPGVEEESVPGEDATVHDRGPTTETETERGTGTGTGIGIGTGTGDDIQHGDELGKNPNVFNTFLFITRT